MTSKPIAVLISDVHYNINTLDVADQAMHVAIDKANDLNVSLIIAGDLHDTKANIRGECVIAMRKTLCQAKNPVVILRGNHDSLNEKSTEHSLNFLPINCQVIAEPIKYDAGLLRHFIGNIDGAYLIPYQHDLNAVKKYIDTIPKGSLLIMHQGVLGSKAGHYIQDKSACPSEWFADYRVISGHYHERQDIKCGRPQKGAIGLWSYLGNPYTLNFSEANTNKGYNILYDDGSLEFVPLDLRRHRLLEYSVEQLKDDTIPFVDFIDIVRVRVTGTQEELSKITKKQVAIDLDVEQDFQLDLIPLDIKSSTEVKSTHTQPEVLDNLIGSLTNVSDEQKKRLKTLWKDLIDEDTIVSSP